MPAVISASSVSRSAGPSRAITGVSSTAVQRAGLQRAAGSAVPRRQMPPGAIAGVAVRKVEPPGLRKLGRQIVPVEVLERRAVRLLECWRASCWPSRSSGVFDDHADQQVSWFNHRVVAVLQHRDPPHRAWKRFFTSPSICCSMWSIAACRWPPPVSGRDGVITVEESPTMGLESETEGLQFDKGDISPYFITDPERLEAVLEDAYILVYQSDILSMQDFLPLLEKIARPSAPMPVIADDVEGEAAAILVVDKIRGLLNVVAVKAPGSVTAGRPCWPTSRCSTGGTVVTEEVGLELDSVGLEELGRARRIVVTKDTTTVVDGAGDKSAIEDRIRQIRTEIENTDSDWDREKLQERLAKLSGGVCVLRVGAATEVELKEKKHRLEDAISATRAAIEEGIIAGGGSALVHLARDLDDLGRKGDEATGVLVVKNALSEPGRDRVQRGPGGFRRGGQYRHPPAGMAKRGHRRVRRPGGPGRHRPVKVTRFASAMVSTRTYEGYKKKTCIVSILVEVARGSRQPSNE